MKEAWIAGAGFVLGWLTSKIWQDPGCQLGLVVFLVAAAAMALASALALVGHRRTEGESEQGGTDEGDSG